MSAPEHLRARSEVSVIVPARNEEACLGACLASLTPQSGLAFDITVVDDGSTDQTRAIAESFPGVHVISPPPLPQGWTGKNNAAAAGAAAAYAPWLLFTDADTVHLPGSLAASLAEASQQQAALLSYSPQQDVRGFWEKSVMPVIFAELASTYCPRDVSDPASPAAAANGQYLLISREAYQAVGGHAAVATSLLEDVALARAVKKSGRKIFFRYGGDRVQTRMYRSFAQLREGWTKNLAVLFPSAFFLAIRRAAEFLLILALLALAIGAASRGLAGLAIAVAVIGILMYGLFLWRIRKAHFSWDSTLFAILGLPIFAYLLARSRLSYKKGTVLWKGRSYGKALSGRLSRGTN